MAARVAAADGCLENGAGAPPVQALTGREPKVLRLVAHGYANRQTAEFLVLSEWTVRIHVSALLTRLGVRDRTTVVLRALHEGLLS